MWTFKGHREPDQILKQKAEKALQELLLRADLGFFREATLDRAISQVQQSSSLLDRFDEIVLIGLGGSSLGARALIDALVPSSQKKKIHFLDNVDSFSLENWLDSNKDKPNLGWILCSKSGGTIEAMVLFDFCSQFFEQKTGRDIAKDTIVISEDKESLISNFANKNDCPILHVPFDVGGRYSVFTPVGLLPALFFSLKGEEFKKGCLWTLQNKKLVQEVIAQIWMSHLQGEKVFYSYQYCDRLNTFGLWFQQLWSESLGKAKTLKGEKAQPAAVFVPCRGASDQHSILQQIVDGPDKKMVCFHRVETSEQGSRPLKASRFDQSLVLNKRIGDLMAVQADATEQAIRESHAGTMVLKTRELNPESMGALMMLWMLVIGSVGQLLEINAFDQPGVESGKIIARRVLSQAD